MQMAVSRGLLPDRYTGAQPIGRGGMGEIFRATDTTLGPARVSTIRVLLADRRKTLTLSSEVPFTVKDGMGTKHSLAAGTVSFGPGLRLAVDGNTSPQKLAAPLTFVAGKGGPLTLRRPYRGKIQVDLVDGKLRAIDVVGLERYLCGVVPSEMPSTWAPEALKAQAVAARSYALATRQVAAPFDVYSDTRSQMYLGVSHESPAAIVAGQLLVATISGPVVESDTEPAGAEPLFVMVQLVVALATPTSTSPKL